MVSGTEPRAPNIQLRDFKLDNEALPIFGLGSKDPPRRNENPITLGTLLLA